MIRVGTRGSTLATTQTRWVCDQLTHATGESYELVIIRTEGDNVTKPLTGMTKPGAFVAALRDALIAGSVDIAVHSYKDLPSQQPDELVVAAVPTRENPADVLVGCKLHDLPIAAKVGTSSPRRAAGLRRVRPDLDLVPIRGNVDTRIRKTRSGEVAAAVLAAAGMQRLGRLGEAAEFLDFSIMLPAPAQGALAVECRHDWALLPQLSELNHSATALAVAAERAVLVGIDAACTTAVGAYATLSEDILTLSAELSEHQGVGYAHVERSTRLDHDDRLVQARQLGFVVAQELLGV